MKMKGLVLVALLVLVSFFVLTGIALAQDADGGTEIALALAPLVAAAAVVERILETGFDWYENGLRNVSKFTEEVEGQIKGYRDWIRRRIHEWEVYAAEAAKRGAVEVKGGTWTLRNAEDELAKFKRRLEAHLKSPAYTTGKRRITLVVGMVLGVAVAFFWRLGMLKLLGLWDAIALQWVDYVITGLVIGTGSAPVHSLIGLLQKSRDAVESARGLWSSQKEEKVRGFLADQKDIAIKELEEKNRELRRAYEKELTALTDRLQAMLEQRKREREGLIKQAGA